MKAKNFTRVSKVALMLGFFIGAQASAATAVVKCTDTGIIRSSISVAGAGIGAGNYFALVGSDGKAYKSGIKPADSFGRISFIFDSKVLAGTTRIPADFIHTGLPVYGYIREAVTSKYIAAIGAFCTNR